MCKSNHRTLTQSHEAKPVTPQVKVPNSQDSCDFEADKCIWRDSVKDTDFFWVRQEGCTPSYSTGPCEDHTTGTQQGHYMYVEASWPRTEGDVAELQSEWLSTTNVRKLYTDGVVVFVETIFLNFTGLFYNNMVMPSVHSSTCFKIRQQAA